MRATRKVLLVGAGEAGSSHLWALERIDDVDVIGAVDPDDSRQPRFEHHRLPRYNSLDETRSIAQPDIVVIATPTPIHAQTYLDAAKHFPGARVLVEKPVADNIADARRILGGDSGGPAVDVVLHMAYAPEVLWAADLVRARPADFAAPIAATSWSADPYQLSPKAPARFGSSWLDSGINALSVLNRFADSIERRSLRQIAVEPASVYDGLFDCQYGGARFTATIVTSWQVVGRARRTSIQYARGAEIMMDHHAGAAYARNANGILAAFGPDGKTPRRESHYLNMYRSWLVDDQPIAAPGAALRLHELLLAPADL